MTAPLHRTRSAIVRHLDPPPAATTVAVLVGDVLVLLAFVVYGLWSHNVPAWEFPGYSLRTFAPFLLGWLLVAPLAGAYRREALRTYRGTLTWISVAWLGATLVGGAIRATSYFHGGAPIDFLLVNFGFGLAFLLPWRLAATALVRRQS